MSAVSGAGSRPAPTSHRHNSDRPPGNDTPGGRFSCGSGGLLALTANDLPSGARASSWKFAAGVMVSVFLPVASSRSWYSILSGLGRGLPRQIAEITTDLRSAVGQKYLISS